MILIIDPGRKMENERTEYLVLEVWGPMEMGAFYMYVKWELLSLHHLRKYEGNKQGILSQETLINFLSLTDKMYASLKNCTQYCV